MFINLQAAVSLDAEFGEILKLGIEAEESCNPMARAVGTEALKLFPEEFVKHYKTTAKNKEEGQKNYASPIQYNLGLTFISNQ